MLYIHIYICVCACKVVISPNNYCNGNSADPHTYGPRKTNTSIQICMYVYIGDKYNIYIYMCVCVVNAHNIYIYYSNLFHDMTFKMLYDLYVRIVRTCLYRLGASDSTPSWCIRFYTSSATWDGVVFQPNDLLVFTRVSKEQARTQ